MGRDLAVFFLAHQWSDSIGHRFARLQREAGGHADCFVLLQDDGGEVVRRWRGFLESTGVPGALRLFDADALPRELGYPYYGDGRVMGNAHFPLAWAARSGTWTHCWQIESDVEWRGNWLGFLRRFDGSSADLLVSHVYGFRDWPSWRWWRTLSLPEGVQIKVRDLRKGFFPVFRISRGALATLELAHRAGWTGYFEALVPTVLVAHGHSIEDLNSVAVCYVPGSQDPSPIVPLQSSMRWRPAVRATEFKQRAQGPLLFHPVKRNWAYDGAKVVRWPEPEAPQP